MICLRGGHETGDSRLDRLPEFDPRSRRYGVMDAVDRPTARSYTWRCNTWLDQGREGACTGYSRAHWIACRPVVAAVTDEDARRLYERAKVLDQWEGENYEGSSVIAAVKAAEEEGHVASYHWAFGVDELAVGIARFGPAVLGINWHAGMLETNDDGYVRPVGSVVGGHAILCRGVSVRLRRFVLRNSWGKGWGIDGDCYVAWDDMGRLLDEQGEACFAKQRRVRARPPE